jgi:phosphoenolpyruvate carboxykinase (ATP)
MEPDDRDRRKTGLIAHGIESTNAVWWNLPTPALYEHAVQRREGLLAHLGPLVVRTGQYKGRSPEDRFLVREPGSESRIWWGRVNKPFEERSYERLRSRLLAYLRGMDLFVQDCYAGADPRYRVPVRVITQMAWHSLFARNMFLQEPDPRKLLAHVPEFTVIDAPGFHAHPEHDGTRSEAFVLIHFGRREVIIGGTLYAGEIKKAMLTVMSFLLPPRGVLPLQCSATCGSGRRDTAILIGLSGTGKTTLSADPERTLIGDDEHGWTDRGLYNIEGGCYAKVAGLSPAEEPQIYEMTRRFGTVLENVAIDPGTRRLDLHDSGYTENTRASYPLSHLPNAARDGLGGHPRHIVMLTADAFGVLPPVAMLTPAQAMYHFLSGYTAKIAGAEMGVEEPHAVFNACFGAPFLALPPVVYANLLGERIGRYGSRVWLLNTGWTGGPYGIGGRIGLGLSRAMLADLLEGNLDGVATREDPVFGFRVPLEVPGVPREVLDPRSAWRDPGAYDRAARELAALFDENFARFEGEVSREVLEASPRRAA